MELFLELIKQIFLPIVAVIFILLFINFVITMIVEVIRNQEMSRRQKLLWSMTILLIQPVGVFMYLAAARYYNYDELHYV